MCVLVLLCIGAAGYGQDFSRREEIAIFRLSYYGQPVFSPPVGVEVRVVGRRGSLTVSVRGTGNPEYDQLFERAFGAVDEQIRSVFINLGRFSVIGMEQRLTQDSVSDFISVLSDYQFERQDLPDAVLLGQQAFTEADFRALSGGFIVVVPSVSWYDLRRLEDGRFRADIEASFTFVDVQNRETFSQFFVSTSGVSANASQAVRDAVDAIAPELSFRVRGMDRFRIRTGVLDVAGRDVIIEFGRNMGLRPGEEYAIVADRVLPNGRIVTAETGLLVVREVQNDVSYARVLYARPGARVGDQLREVPRRGVEAQLYFDLMTDGATSLAYLIGLRAVPSRGFFAGRPYAAFEIPVRSGQPTGGLPMNVVLGGEWNLLIGRIRLTPSGGVGLGGGIAPGDDQPRFYASHIGAIARLTGSLLLTRDILVSVQTGYGLWADLTGRDDSYGGLIVGAAVIFK